MKKIKKQWLPVIWFSGFLYVFFLIDLLTKHFLFDYHNLYELTGKIQYQNPFFGIRSLEHDNSTLFSWINWNSPVWARILINLALAVIVTIPAFFTKHIGQNIGLAIIVAGIMGNSVDIMFTKGHFVKDILFTPWLDKGTFNFADMWIVVGAITFLITTIFKTMKDKNTNISKS